MIIKLESNRKVSDLKIALNANALGIELAGPPPLPAEL
jgi:hypothetical protein